MNYKCSCSDESGPKKTDPGRARAWPGIEPFTQGWATGQADFPGLVPYQLILKNIIFTQISCKLTFLRMAKMLEK